ncbi:MAG: rRNA maturation RNase YbeY, partial [Alphaproteobacteria bacterium]|nr:rRNA maturation RNase YbeY [Alphaproteobacteria bacterium]
LGDIILAYETVRDEAKEQDKRFEDHATHLIVHGLLHLLGHDHIEEADAQIMESLEIEILRTLNIKNPYDHESFVA